MEKETKILKQDSKEVKSLKQHIQKTQKTLTAIAKALDLSTATLHLWLNNNYSGNVEKINAAVKKYLEIEKLRDERVKIRFFNTSIVKEVFEIARTCQVENEICVCCGDAGLGKTYAVRRYAQENSNVILIEADLGYTPKVLFSELHKALGFDGIGTLHKMFLDVVGKLKQTGRLIIVDEAEHLPYKSLELLRRVYDKAQVGILLVGMQRLIMNLKGESRQYSQLYSRVGLSVQLHPLTIEDQTTIISSLLPDQTRIYPLISGYCAGNTRVLTKLLVRALRIAEINNVEIDENVINVSIGQMIM